MALDLGKNPGACDAAAQKFGAVALTMLGCSPVSGRVIPITADGVSVMEGFEITNFNMHAYGNKPAAPTPDALPGPVKGLQIA